MENFKHRYFTCVSPDDPHSTVYHGADTPENFNKKYTGPNFTYNFNNLGFRGEEIDAISPAIVSFGPSLSAGYGVPQELRYGDLVANNNKSKHFSFGGHGGDSLTILSNINSFFLNNKENINVKFISVMWPDTSRFSFYNKETNPLFISSIGAGFPTLTKEQENFMLYWTTNVSELYTIEMARSVDLLCKSHNIPCVQLCHTEMTIAKNFKIDSLYFDKDWYIWNLLRYEDRGRDNHPGIKTHQNIADLINKIIDSEQLLQ